MQTINPHWQLFESVAAVRDAACAAVVHSAEEAIAQRGCFTLVLAGGTTPRDVYRQLCSITTDWSKWHIYYGDERCLPTDHAERNSRMAEEAWLNHVGIPPQQIHAIPAELGPELGAAQYCRVLAQVGEFDLVLLGLGEDGHTASLFPDNLLELDGAPAIPVRGAPKPPAERISLSSSRLSNARRVIFLVTGAGKREAVKQWRNGSVKLPAAAIQPSSGAEIFLDAACVAP
jgi:6-phosphogluconolactonase